MTDKQGASPPQPVFYDLVMEAWHGRVQDTFALARAYALVLNRPIIVRGNQTAVKVEPGMSDEQCRDAYTKALEEGK